MSRANFWAILAIACPLIALTPAARADTFNLNVNQCNCIPTSLGGIAGTVTVTAPATNEVEIVVSLNSPLQFHQTSGLDAFDFNAVGFSLTSANITINNNGGSTWALVGSGSQHEDGLGTFMYSLECTAGANGCVTAPVRTLDFTITASGLTLAAVENRNSNASNTDFGANVANANTSGCTGMVGAGNGTAQSTATGTTSSGCLGTTPPSVPEPTSIAFLGTGLLGLLVVARRKVSSRG